MTPEQIAAHCLLGAAFKTPEAADDVLAAIATALRQARNEALEEAKKAAEGEMEHTPDDSWYHAAETIAEQIEALKHKEGQP